MTRYILLACLVVGVVLGTLGGLRAWDGGDWLTGALCLVGAFLAGIAFGSTMGISP
jgi:hypothetical protein